MMNAYLHETIIALKMHNLVLKSTCKKLCC